MNYFSVQGLFEIDNEIAVWNGMLFNLQLGTRCEEMTSNREVYVNVQQGPP